MLGSLFIALSTLATAFAQNQTVQVKVGGAATDPGGIFQFNPNTITASNGSVVNFQFTGIPGNHSITQSSFDAPCTPIGNGFDSGWVLISSAPSDASDTPEWNLTITDDSQPIWFFCKQLIPEPHCPAGMVGAINAPTSGSNTFAAYMSNAQSFSGNVGQGMGFLVGQGASASAGPGPIVDGVQTFAVPSAGATPSSVANSASGTSATSASTTSAAPSNAGFALIASGKGLLVAIAFGISIYLN